MTDDDPDVVTRLERIRRLAGRRDASSEHARLIVAELDALLADVRAQRHERILERSELADAVLGIRDRLPASPNARTDRDTLTVVAAVLG